MNKKDAERLENAARKHLVDVCRYNEERVCKFLNDLDMEEEGSTADKFYLENLADRYREYYSYSIYEIRRIMEKELCFTPKDIIDYMGPYVENKTFPEFSGFFHDAENEDIEKVIMKAVIKFINDRLVLNAILLSINYKLI